MLDLSQSHDEAKDPRPALHQFPVQRIEAGCTNPYEDFAVPRLGFWSFLQAENVGGTKFAIDDSLHP
jgi:hypothetical protein